MIKTKKSFFGLVTLSLIMFMVTLDTTITNIALPDITSAFNSNLTDTNWISTIYVLVMAIVIIPASKFGDQFGRKKLMALGLIIFGIGSALCGFSKTLPILIGMRFFQGIGGAIVTPIMIPLSVSLFGRKDANQAVGIIGAVTAVAAAAGPPIGGVILKFLSWQWIFFVNVPIVLLTFVLLLFCFKESFDPTISKKIDFSGLIFLTLCLSQLTFLLVKGYDLGWTSIASFSLMVGTLITAVIFLWIEQHSKAPLIELHLFKEITFSASAIIYFMCGFAIICSSLIFNFFLENVRGYSALSASYIIMFMSITVMIAMPIGSKLAVYIGYRIIITVGMVLMAASLFLLTTLKPNTPKQLMIGYMIVLGLGFGFACLSIVSAVQFIPENKAGIASGIVNAARQLGTCLGIALLVGMMTHNVATAKTDIKNMAVVQIAKQQLPDNLSGLIQKRLTTSLNSKQEKADPNFQTSLQHEIRNELKKTETEQSPQNNQLAKIHHGLIELTTQFKDKPNTVSGLADQVQSGQAQANSQTEVVLYELIKQNPNAPSVLAGYRNEYAQVQSQPDSDNKNELITQLKFLIALYQAGTDPQVTNAAAFSKALSSVSAGSAQHTLAKAQAVLTTTLSEKGEINQKMTKLDSGIAKIDIANRIEQLLIKIKTTKNQQLTKAFSKTFMLAAWIIASLSFVGLLTERKHIE
ncbi:hypothetical protein JCM14202_1723 [Agrilactobacillus composti DSM 18527 = JCM 14202]|uniref:MFS transporter n=1 Tax=Agrilactobacillus composti TaxID=398555 RepID=UPI00042DF8CC|nr:DHA2 family efflux MFS transporter permease subunit [Agrilactobacillus composti]GAF39846.1 hypothetical protein JCM14202_1723 [Agrilactobacillus composti DSM 18527 = JCM 14202]